MVMPLTKAPDGSIFYPEATGNLSPEESRYLREFLADLNKPETELARAMRHLEQAEERLARLQELARKVLGKAATPEETQELYRLVELPAPAAS